MKEKVQLCVCVCVCVYARISACMCTQAHIQACMQSSESLPPAQTKHIKWWFTVTLYPLYATHQTTVRPHAHTHQMCVLYNHLMVAYTRITHKSSHLTNSNHLLFMWFYVEKRLSLLGKY